jgi:hypothetical protein
VLDLCFSVYFAVCTLSESKVPLKHLAPGEESYEYIMDGTEAMCKNIICIASLFSVFNFCHLYVGLDIYAGVPDTFFFAFY